MLCIIIFLALFATLNAQCNNTEGYYDTDQCIANNAVDSQCIAPKQCVGTSCYFCRDCMNDHECDVADRGCKTLGNAVGTQTMWYDGLCVEEYPGLNGTCNVCHEACDVRQFVATCDGHHLCVPETVTLYDNNQLFIKTIDCPCSSCIPKTCTDYNNYTHSWYPKYYNESNCSMECVGIEPVCAPFDPSNGALSLDCYRCERECYNAVGCDIVTGDIGCRISGATTGEYDGMCVDHGVEGENSCAVCEEACSVKNMAKICGENQECVAYQLNLKDTSYNVVATVNCTCAQCIDVTTGAPTNSTTNPSGTPTANPVTMSPIPTTAITTDIGSTLYETGRVQTSETVVTEHVHATDMDTTQFTSVTSPTDSSTMTQTPVNGCHVNRINILFLVIICKYVLFVALN